VPGDVPFSAGSGDRDLGGFLRLDPINCKIHVIHSSQSPNIYLIVFG